MTDALDPGLERGLAAALFNRTWDLLRLQDRSPEQTDELIHTVHASCYHWGQVGEPVHRARGEWMISRVYAVLGRPEGATHHAQRCLEICQEHGIGDFDIAFAYEALARAARARGAADAAASHRARAVELGEKIADEEDRKYFFSDLDWEPAP